MTKLCQMSSDQRHVMCKRVRDFLNRILPIDAHFGVAIYSCDDTNLTLQDGEEHGEIDIVYSMGNQGVGWAMRKAADSMDDISDVDDANLPDEEPYRGQWQG